MERQRKPILPNPFDNWGRGKEKQLLVEATEAIGEYVEYFGKKLEQLQNTTVLDSKITNGLKKNIQL